MICNKAISIFFSDQIFTKNFNFVNWGFNVRPTELQAGFGLEQIKKVNRFNLRRRKLYKLFTSKFGKNPNIFFPLIEKKSDPSWFAIPIILSEKSKFKRTQLVSFLEKNGIETKLINTSNKINKNLNSWILNKINFHLKNISNVLVVGLAYKKNINDLRESPALKIYRYLLKKKKYYYSLS